MADQWTKHLADKGYTGLSLPSGEFGLLTLVFEDRGARGHDNSFDILAPGVRAQLPPPERDAMIPSISGERTRGMDVGFGLKFLAGLISALGAGTLGLDAGFRAARKLSFTYDGLSSETLNAVALQSRLNAVPAPTADLLRDWLDDHLYVVTSVLRAKKITVTGHDESGGEVGLDVPVIAGAVGGSVKAKATGANDSTVTFEGEAPVPIAVRLYEVLRTKIEGERMLTLRTVKQGAATVRSITGAVGHTGGRIPLDRPDAGTVADEPSAVVLDWQPEDAVTDAR